MKVNTLQRALVEAFSNKFRSRATVHQCTQMFVSVSSQSGSTKKELSSQAAWRVAQEFLMFPGFLNDYFEVSQSVRRLVRILVVHDPSQKSAEDGMFGHPTRDSLDLVATNCWFLHDDSDRNMITRYEPLTKIVRNMRVSETHTPLP